MYEISGVEFAQIQQKIKIKKQIAVHIEISMMQVIFKILSISLLVSVASAIRCYDCNSFYDPQCADPFKDFALGSVECDEKGSFDGVNATFCRKMYQKSTTSLNDIIEKKNFIKKIFIILVDEKVRVIRSCGYIADLEEQPLKKKCRRRSPSKGVEIFSCECRGELCNTSQNLNANIYFIVIAAIISVLDRIII